MDISEIVIREMNKKQWNVYEGEDIWEWPDVVRNIFKGKVNKMIPEKSYILLPLYHEDDNAQVISRMMDTCKYPPCYVDLYYDKKNNIYPKGVFLIDSIVISPKNELHYVLAQLDGKPLRVAGFNSVNLVVKPEDIESSIKNCVNKYKINKKNGQ